MKIIETRKIKVLQAIMDWNLWPRYEVKALSHQHIKRLIQSMEAGIELPPIIIEAKGMRIVDGFHRVKAVRRLYGDSAEIMAELREYDSDKEILIDSARINNAHGLRLNDQDRTHTMLKLWGMGASLEEQGYAVGLTKEETDKFLSRRVVSTSNGEKIPLTGPGVRVLDEKYKNQTRRPELSKSEEDYMRGTGGLVPVAYVKLLIKALRAGVYPLNEREAVALRKLIDLSTSAYLAFLNKNGISDDELLAS